MYCGPATDPDPKDAVVITFGREMARCAGCVLGNVREDAAVDRAPRRRRPGGTDGLYAATACEVIAFDEQLHAGQKLLLPGDLKSCLKQVNARLIATSPLPFPDIAGLSAIFAPCPQEVLNP